MKKGRAIAPCRPTLASMKSSGSWTSSLRVGIRFWPAPMLRRLVDAGFTGQLAGGFFSLLMVTTAMWAGSAAARYVNS